MLETNNPKQLPIERSRGHISGYGGSVFGKANRPSTPIQGVISNTYANLAE